jgi:hypothetical protein
MCLAALVILLLKNFLNDFHFVIKIVPFDVFIALPNFGDIVWLPNFNW